MLPPAKRLRADVRTAVKDAEPQEKRQERLANDSAVRHGQAKLDPPLSVSSDWGSALKEEKEEDDKGAIGLAPASHVGVFARSGLHHGAATNGHGVPFSISESLAASQAKLEEKVSSFKEEVLEPGLAGTAGAVGRDTTLAEPPLPEPVVHPTGTWLAGLCNNLRSRAQPEAGTDLCSVDGVRFHRPLWRPGAVEVVQGSASQLPGSGSGPRLGRARRAAAASSCRNFKLFRKADGQRSVTCTDVVPVAPWVPAARAALSEVFGSQPLGDEDSQVLYLPPGV